MRYSHWLDEKLSEAHNPIASKINAEEKEKKEFKKYIQNVKILIEYIYFERTIKAIRPIKETLRLNVDYI